MAMLIGAFAPQSVVADAPSAVATTSKLYSLNIHQLPLSEALKEFAAQTQLQFARFADSESVNLLVGPLSGSFTAEDALSRLLSGSGLGFHFVNSRTIAIVKAATSAPNVDIAAVPAPRGAQEIASAKPSGDTKPREVDENRVPPRSEEPPKHRSFLSKLFSFITLCSAAAVASNPACAQAVAQANTGAESEPLEEIVVTGTSIRGIAPTGSELVTISREDVLATGASTSTELLRSVPQLNLFNATGINTGSNQANFVDQPAIHGIGVGNGGAGLTLVLFDGHRLPGAGINQTAPDAGVIPTSAIERVEVMADGGSSVYGSDAVAGVINFVPRRNFDGAETSGRFGFGDAYHTDNFSQLLGKSWGSGSVLFDYEYSYNSALNGRDRGYAVNNQAPFGGPDTRSSVCSPANVTVGGVGYALSASGAPTAGATNLCETNRANDLYPEQRRNQFYLSAHQDVNEAVDLYASTLFSERTIRDHVSGSGVTSGGLTVTVPSSSPYYIAMPGAPAGASESVTYDPASDFGDFTNRITTSTSSTVVGTNIKLPHDWNAKIELNYGVEHDDVREFGINQTVALSAANAGTFNPYGVGPANNPAVLAQIGDFETRYFARQLLEEGQAKLDGPMFSLPGGSARIAFGLDVRREEFDGITSSGPIEGPVTPYAANGSRTSDSGFVELYLPFVGSDQGIPGIRKLDVSISGRYDHYSDVGSTTNPKLGLNWTVIDGLLVRASAGRSFHAPSLADAPTAIDTRAIRFPCIPGAFQGCDAAPAGAYTVILAGGNTLKPETARTYNLGFDLNPAQFGGFKASATLFKVDYNNVITFPTFAPVTNPDPAYSKYRTLRPAGLTDAEWLAIITPLLAGFRHDGLVYPDDPNLPTAIYDLRRQNFANERINGLDYDLGYRLETTAGTFNVDLAGTQMMTFYQTIPGVASPVQLLDTDYAPHTRARAQFGWAYQNYAASLFVNYTGKYRNQAVTPFQEVNSFTTMDTHIAWSLPGEGLLTHAQLTLDVSNLLDKNPPLYFTSGTNGIVGFDGSVASAIGRVIAVGFHKSW